MRIRVSVVSFLLAFGPTVVAKDEKMSRIVSVSVLLEGTDADGAVMDYHQFLQDAFFKANCVFEKEFGIKFKIIEFSAGKWFVPSDNFDGNAELESLTNLPANGDIVAAFTTKKFFGEASIEIDGEWIPTKRRLAGLAAMSGRHAIVSLEEKSELILIHEIGHLFGVDHTFDLSSVMHSEAVQTANFDKNSKEVIRANKYRKF